jgi:hypothetical protein
MPVMLDVALQRSWRDPKKDVNSSYPFHKLKDLNVAGKANIAILQSLEHVCVGGPNHTKVQGLYFPYCLDTSSRLRRLVLMDVSVNPRLLESVIDDFGCPGMEELCVRQATWYDYNSAILSGALVSYTPNLRTLEWTQYEYYRHSEHVQPFGSLRGPQNLTTLALDYTLMTPASGNADPIHLLDAETYLPDSLKSLNITEIMLDDAQSLCSRYLQNYSPTAVAAFVLNRLARTLLSTIKLSISLWDWFNYGMRELPRRIRQILRQLVARLHQMDVNLAVWRAPNGVDEGRLLYEPGFEAPWPHLDDVERGCWAAETTRLWEIKTEQKRRPNDLDEAFLAEELSDDDEEQR